MLKYELETIDELDDAVKALYTKADDGKFRLGVEGLPQPQGGDELTGLKRKVSELLDEKKKADKAKKDSEEAAKKALEEAARKSGDVQALEKSWQEKLAAREAELSSQVSKLDGSLRDVLVESVAKGLAAEIAIPGSANVLLPHIRARLAVDYVDDKPVTRILDAAGKPSAATLDDLKNEFAGNAAFAPIVAGTKASGGGAAGAGRGGAGVKSMTRSDYEALDANGKAEFAKRMAKGEARIV